LQHEGIHLQFFLFIFKAMFAPQLILLAEKSKGDKSTLEGGTTQCFSVHKKAKHLLGHSHLRSTISRDRFCVSFSFIPTGTSSGGGNQKVLYCMQ